MLRETRLRDGKNLMEGTVGRRNRRSGTGVKEAAIAPSAAFSRETQPVHNTGGSKSGS